MERTAQSIERTESAPMTPALRKLSLTAHVTSSVGWLGAVVGFLVLSIAGLTSQDADTVRGAYVAMNLIGQFAIVPLSIAALLTGLAQSLGTHWGLFRHYWVLVKLTLTVASIIALLLHQFTAVTGAAQRVTGTAPGILPDVGRLGPQLVGDSGLALLVLLAITTLATYKPWGRTSYGRRKQRQSAESRQQLGTSPTSTAPARPDPDSAIPLGLKIFLAVIGAMVVAFIVLHLAGGGLGDHGM